MNKILVVVFMIGGFTPPILFSESALAEEIQNPAVAEIKEETNPWWGRSFDKQSQFILLTGALSSAIATGADNNLRDQWMNNQKMDVDATRAGDFLGSGAAGVSIALGQYFLDRENGIAHGKSLIAATLWTTAAKGVFNRKRPGTNPHYNSFPSGHTSTSFTTATSLYYSYGWKVGLPAYLLATGVGLSRISDDVHWFSDVVAGAFIGIWLGRAYHHNVENGSDETPNSPPETTTMVLPSFENNTVFIQVLSQF